MASAHREEVGTKAHWELQPAGRLLQHCNHLLHEDDLRAQKQTCTWLCQSQGLGFAHTASVC